MKLEFFKYHGLGNDYVLLDETRRRTGLEKRPAKIREICDRRFGIGSDGVLLVQKSARAGVRMRMFNPDGSESEMCGNGVRCVAKYAFDHGLVGEKSFLVETGAGIKKIEVAKTGGGKAELLVVGMGSPVFGRQNAQVNACGEKIVFSEASMGNPHAVVFEESDEKLAHERVGRLGPEMERNKMFPNKTNVEFVRAVSKTGGRMVVWERGAGMTLACGTGTCASVAVGAKKGLFARGAWVKMRLDGGDLYIKIAPGFSQVWMKGPAKEVFRGTIQL